MPASRNISAGMPMSNNLSNSNSSNSHDTNLDWQAIEESLQDDDTNTIADVLSKLDIKEPHSPSKASETLILTSIEKLHNNDIVIRSGAMAILTHAFVTNNKSIASHLISLVRAVEQPSLLDLKTGRNQTEYVILHKNICALLNNMQFKEPDKLLPNFKPLASYLIQCTGHDICDIATVACEYWARLPVPPVPDKHLDPWVPSVMTHLGKLVPNLLKCLIYHEEHIMYLENQASNSSGRNTPTHMEQFTNRRNYAAMGLENISRIFPTETLNALKPYIQRWLVSKDWRELEAIILAIGALTQALGAVRDLKDFYPTLIMPRLLESFSHPKPLVRAITCFTMQVFINIDPRSLNIKDPFAKIVRCTLQLLRDPNEEVQQMAAQCLSTMLAYSNKDINPFSRKLIDEIIKADKVIQGQVRFTYYECIAHLFGRMAVHMDRDDITCLVVPFMNHWNRLNSESTSNGSSQNIGQDILLLSQPLCTIAMYGRHHMEPYNKEMLEKIANFLADLNPGSDSGTGLTTQKTVAYLDITSALLEGQGSNLSSMLSEFEIGGHLLRVLQSTKFSHAVHQSSLALLGNLSKYCYNLIHPYIEKIIPVIQRDINSSMTEIRNNSVWAFYNIVQNCPDCHSKFEGMGEDLTAIIKKQDADEGIIVNASLALTSLAAKWPDRFASLLTSDTMFGNVCNIMQRPFPRDLEKVTLYQNVCLALTYDPSKISVTGWVQFCVAAALLESPDDTLRLKLKNTLHNGRSTMGNKNWAKVTQQIGSQLASTLRRRFRLY